MNSIIDIFMDEAKEILKEGGAALDQERAEDICEILNQSMATNSALYGLSMKRVNNFNEQKQSLIEDIKKGVAEGWLKPLEVTDAKS